LKKKKTCKPKQIGGKNEKNVGLNKKKKKRKINKKKKKGKTKHRRK
jgi:hypothetical protein